MNPSHKYLCVIYVIYANTHIKKYEYYNDM